MATLTNLSISYPNFKLNDTIDPDQFDTNNADIVNKINSIVSEENAKDTRLTAVEGSTLGQISKLPNGTTFPVSPTTGFIYYRTDLDLTFVYNGTAWEPYVGGKSYVYLSGDCNSIDTTGHYTMTGTSPNSPFTSGAFFYLINTKYDASNRHQIAMSYNSNDNSMYTRNQSSGSWSAWAKVAISTTTSTGWQNLSLQNSWVYYGSGSLPQYRRDQFGAIYVKGLIKGGATGNSTVLFTLPVGYRPADHHYFACFDGANVLQRLEISNTDGTVFISNGGVALNNGFLVLDTIFICADV